MKFNFFIYYPKMPSGPYYTTRQLTSRIYMLCSLKSRLFFNSFQSLGLPGGSAGNEPTCNERDLISIPEWGRTPGEGKGYPLQYSGLENSTDCIVHGVAKSWTRLSNFHFHHCRIIINCTHTKKHLKRSALFTL